MSDTGRAQHLHYGLAWRWKILLARALPGILPEMSIEESLDVTRIYSVADQLLAGTPLIRHRPFRASHHTISHADWVGARRVNDRIK